LTTNEGGTIRRGEPGDLRGGARSDDGIGFFSGLTTNCAQCHDHKFDPITMRDFYSMAAFFRNTKQGAFDGNNREGNGPLVVLSCGAKTASVGTRLPGIIESDDAVSGMSGARHAEGDFKAWLAKVDVSVVEGELPNED